MKEQLLTDSRIAKIKAVVAKRQDVAVILENVLDPHNIGAVVRSCDAIGVKEVFIVYTTGVHNAIKQKIGKNASSGALKWIKVHFFSSLQDCIEVVRSRYTMIFGTHLNNTSVSLYELDLTLPIAFIFGNEQHGLSEDALTLIDKNFIVPQHGMVQSLNISVACAITLFEACRQRTKKDMYNQEFDEDSPTHKELFDFFLERHFSNQTPHST